MFTSRNSTTEMSKEKTTATTLIGAGTVLKGNISSSGDLRIDGTLVGNISSTAKIVIGSSGVVEGDLNGDSADVVGKVSGNIRVKELLHLRDDCVVNGNIYAGKLQVEPSATFNGQCQMGANVVDMLNTNELATSVG